MAERAQRAKWMKTDPNPDYEIPMMIDYINDPPNKNNSIRSTYFGGGYYSGFIIDCDGKVLYSTSWGWYAPKKSWWGLPLDPVANLHAFLDKYLKNPPACYKSSGGADAGAKADSGTSSPDSGATSPDSAAKKPDASPAADSAAASPDTSTGGSSGDDDGCAVAGASPRGWPTLGLLALAALAATRRRRR